MDSPAAAAAAAEKSQFPDFTSDPSPEVLLLPPPSPRFSGVVNFPHLDLLSFLIT